MLVSTANAQVAAVSHGKSVVMVLAARQGITGMQIEGLAERGGCIPELCKLRSIVIGGIVRRPYLREAIDHEAMEAQLLDAAFQLACRGTGILQSARPRNRPNVVR